MPLWGPTDIANNAPKFITDAGTGETGIQEYSSDLIMVYGDEGYPVTPGWVRKLVRGNRTTWESIVTFASGHLLEGPYDAPSGYRWQRVTYNGVQVMYDNTPVFYLEEIP